MWGRMMSLRRASSIAGAMALVAVVGACDWFSTMSRTPQIQPHEEAPRLPPEGAIALDGIQAFNLATADDLVNPTPQDAISVARGDAAFTDFCVVCHGAGGRGNGPIADQYPAIPALNTGRLGDFSDGYLFALISQGRGLMPGYSRIRPQERWDIVNFLRTIPVADQATAPQPAASGEEGS